MLENFTVYERDSTGVCPFISVSFFELRLTLFGSDCYSREVPFLDAGLLLESSDRWDFGSFARTAST